MDNSESFDILGDDSDVEIKEDWTPDFRRNQERKRLLKRILKQCGKDDGNTKPLHVAIIGAHGVGKSAFVNTLAAALGGDRWREYAYSGSHGPVGGGITVFTTSFPKCCKSEQYSEILLPTLIDIAGFDNHQGEEYIELLRIVLYGRLPVGESLAEAAQYYKDKGLDGLRTKYSENNEDLKVDRVIFLNSATTEVPENLIQCVIQAARPPGTKDNPNKRTIPIYGVMLKHDKVVDKSEYEKRKSENADLDVVDEETYEKREIKFIHSLGLGGSRHRFLRCSNYCDDVDKDKSRIDTVLPALDIPVLKLFTQVTDPVIQVHNKEESYSDTYTKKGDNRREATPEVQEQVVDNAQNQKSAERGPKRRPIENTLIDSFGENYVSVIMVSFEALFVAFVLSFVLKPPVDISKMKGICKANAGKSNSALTEMCQDVFEVSSSNLSFVLALFLLVLIRVAFSMATVQLYKRK